MAFSPGYVLFGFGLRYTQHSAMRRYSVIPHHRDKTLSAWENPGRANARGGTEHARRGRIEGKSRVALFMIVEHFRNGDAEPVYRRFRERGRLAPQGITYISSWVTEDLTACYQVMESPDRSLLDEWMRNWSDLVEFEVHPVISSQEAAGRVASKA
jgi:Protein of unknown function (DUF3303)